MDIRRRAISQNPADLSCQASQREVQIKSFAAEALRRREISRKRTFMILQ
jgi:hypothetical protein